MIAKFRILNCLVLKRDADPDLFTIDVFADEFTVDLDAYAIIPVEHYHMMRQLANLPADDASPLPS